MAVTMLPFELRRGIGSVHPVDVVLNNDRPNMALGGFTPRQELAMAK